MKSKAKASRFKCADLRQISFPGLVGNKNEKMPSQQGFCDTGQQAEPARGVANSWKALLQPLLLGVPAVTVIPKYQ